MNIYHKKTIIVAGAVLTAMLLFPKDSLAERKRSVAHFAINQKKSLIAIGYEGSNEIKVFSLPTGNLIKSLIGSEEVDLTPPIRSCNTSFLDFSEDGNTLYSLCGNHVLRKWHIQDSQLINNRYYLIENPSKPMQNPLTLTPQERRQSLIQGLLKIDHTKDISSISIIKEKDKALIGRNNKLGVYDYKSDVERPVIQFDNHFIISQIFYKGGPQACIVLSAQNFNVSDKIVIINIDTLKVTKQFSLSDLNWEYKSSERYTTNELISYNNELIFLVNFPMFIHENKLIPGGGAVYLSEIQSIPKVFLRPNIYGTRTSNFNTFTFDPDKKLFSITSSDSIKIVNYPDLDELREFILSDYIKLEKEESRTEIKQISFWNNEIIFSTNYGRVIMLNSKTGSMTLNMDIYQLNFHEVY